MPFEVITNILELQYYNPHGDKVVLRSLDLEFCLSSHLVACVTQHINGQVYFGLAGPQDKSVALKIARGSSEVQRLHYEADIYRTELKHLQGTVVPKFFGLYNTMDTAVMILEHCDTGINSLNADEFNRLFMLAACNLHQAGILHSTIDYHHHILVVGRDIRIIDFAYAGRYHQCAGAIPTLQNHAVPRGCEQLMDLERTYGSQEMKKSHAKLQGHSLQQTMAGISRHFTENLGTNWGWKAFPGFQAKH